VRVALRPATAGDSAAIWRWRNDPETRRASFDEAPVPRETHRRWFADSLARPARRIFVVRVDGADAGMVRLDLAGTDATVSINIAPERRGRGVGTAALAAAAAEAFTRLGARRLVAHVKADNAPSRRAFERAGFAARGQAGQVVTLVRHADGGGRAPRRLALVPARGGSRRFPRKNVALFDGRPLVSRAVDVARAAGVFDRIVVSTEDAEIAALGKAAGAEVHARDRALAADGARVVDVCRAVLDELEAGGDPMDAFAVLLPTSPFRTAAHVRESLALLESRRANVVMSVAPFPHVPQWAVRETRGFLRLYFGRGTLKSRDRLAPLYRHNGVVLWARTAAFRRQPDFYGPRVVPYHMTLEDSVDVDHELDLRFAEFLLRRSSQ
jgi:CMP-N-acetylneuraminic acid synthetase/RimJ/RimL family protein N-acetyltransferase